VRLTKLHPSLPADIFAGQDLVLFARYAGNGNGRIIVEGAPRTVPSRGRNRCGFPTASGATASSPACGRAARRLAVGGATPQRRIAELDDELRELGTRYGIPTELSSYLVLEPGMQEPLRDSSARRRRSTRSS
jgi:hypothetical protein